MAIGSDFSIATNGDIRYTGAAHGASGAGYYTVIEFHRWISGLSGAATSSGDDFMDMTRDTPSDRSTDNIITINAPYNIDDTVSEHLYGGSIIQAGGNTIYDGFVVYANSGMDLQIIQNGAVLTNAFWNTIPFGSSVKGLNPDVNNGISHQFMLKVRTGGADIDGRRVITQTREWGKTFSEFKINGTSRGNNTSALTYSDDLNNLTSVGTVATWTTIAETPGYVALDVNNDTVDEYYYTSWDKGIYSINQFYERFKWLQRRGTSSTISGLNGELFRGITHEIPVNTPSGTFNAYEPVSWSGGTGQMLAVDSTTAPTKMWIQLLTGVVPTNTQVITGGTSTAQCAVNGSLTERTVSTPGVGQSTGTSIIGAYGLGINPLQLSSSDKVTDLTGTQRQAPNYATFVLSNLVSGDGVLVTNNSGGGIDTTQFTLNGALTGGAVTAVVITGSIPADTPATGKIRILRDNGVYTPHAYTSWSGSTFTIPSTDFSSNNASNGNYAYLGYIDGVSSGATMSFTGVYSGDRSLYWRVRNPNGSPKIKTSFGVAVLSSAGGSASASRISDE